MVALQLALPNVTRKIAPQRRGKALLYSIHFLRFVAAFGVTVQHGFPLQTFNLGGAGVDIFFCISGFVIGYSLPPNETSGQFLLKRILRIVPMYWISTGVYSLVRIYDWGDDRISLYWFLRSLFFLPDSGAWTPIYFPAWTLVYEMSFYLIFAALLLFTKPEACRRYALFIMAALASLTVPPSWGGGILFLNNLVLEFAFGLAACEFYRACGPLSKRLGIACLGLSAAVFLQNYFNPPNRVLSWGIASALLIMGLLTFEQLKFFRWKLCVLLGSASYTIYLFHIIIIESIWLKMVRTGHQDWVDASAGKVILIICALLGGVLVHLLIERPIIRLSKTIIGMAKTRSAMNQISSIEPAVSAVRD